MKLYTHPLSSNARRVDLLVSHLELELEREVVDLRAGVQRSPEYRALNPNGKVPMLVDGDFVLWESNAILTYLAAINPDANLLGGSPRERANIERWLFWQSNHLGRTADVLFFERGMKKLFGLGDPDEAVVSKHLERFEAEGAVLNEQLDGQDFVCGELSVADFSLLTSVELVFAAGANVAAFPNIMAWFARCQALPGYIAPPSA